MCFNFPCCHRFPFWKWAHNCCGWKRQRLWSCIGVCVRGIVECMCGACCFLLFSFEVLYLTLLLWQKHLIFLAAVMLYSELLWFFSLLPKIANFIVWFHTDVWTLTYLICCQSNQKQMESRQKKQNCNKCNLGFNCEIQFLFACKHCVSHSKTKKHSRMHNWRISGKVIVRLLTFAH